MKNLPGNRNKLKKRLNIICICHQLFGSLNDEVGVSTAAGVCNIKTSRDPTITSPDRELHPLTFLSPFAAAATTTFEFILFCMCVCVCACDRMGMGVCVCAASIQT